MRRVLVIGGGASGLMAAIQAARSGAKVTLLEQNRQVGKKILVTGNGRCNLTNRDQELSHYRGSDSGFAAAVLQQFGLEETLEFFGGLGILVKDRNGYLYPYSDQASSVAEVLRMEAERLGVKMALGNRILKLSAAGKGFEASTDGWTYEGDACVLAAGSAAAPATGSDGSGYVLAESLGHRVVKPLPALVQLRCRERFFERLAGLRMEASVKILAGDPAPAGGKKNAERKELVEDRGEVQFTKNGISGIPVFQVSRYAVRALDESRRVEARLNLLPRFEKRELEKYFASRRKDGGYKKGEQFLTGLFPGKMSLCLLERAGISKNKKAEDWTAGELERLLLQIRDFQTEIVSGGSFEQAQVCSGGVDTREICPETMESRLVPGLFFAGEVLDIDGACGGYNLQWAWSSGYTAGRSAAKGGKE